MRENHTDANWENPSIRIVFRDNWGGSYTETKSLPSIAPGESSDFSIPVGAYPVTIRSMDTSAWLQIYLDTGDLPSSESYWCVQFHLHGDEKNRQPRKSWLSNLYEPMQHKGCGLCGYCWWRRSRTDSSHTLCRTVLAFIRSQFIDCRNRSVYCNLLASGTSKASIVSAIDSFANFFSRANR